MPLHIVLGTATNAVTVEKIFRDLSPPRDESKPPHLF
jgi:hypothetical protein